jgi:Ca2+/H+ antiporter
MNIGAQKSFPNESQIHEMSFISPTKTFSGLISGTIPLFGVLKLNAHKHKFSTADPDPFETDPDPAFHFDTVPNHASLIWIRILLFNLIRVRILAISKRKCT